MRITNHHNFPAPVVNALTMYEQGGEKVSGLRVTTLIGSPRVSVLRRKYSQHLEEDVSDLVFRVFGSAVHKIFEDAADNSSVSEERLSVNVGGVPLTGAIDYQFVSDDGVDIKDYKTCKAFKITKGDYSDWENQLNVYSFLVRHAKHLSVSSLSVIAIIKDWSLEGTRRNADYPAAALQEISIPLWSPDKQDSYVQDRVRLHQRASFDELPECTDEERWYVPGKFALHKRGRKRAIGLYDSHADAEFHRNGDSDLYIEERKGFSRKCTDYCNVAPFCSQFQKEEGA